MQKAYPRHSPHGRPIRIRDHQQVLPKWAKRRRRAYRLIDSMADAAKRTIRQLLPRAPKTNNAHL